MNVFKRLVSSIMRSGEQRNEGGVSLNPGDVFNVSVSLLDSMEHGGTLKPLCNQVANAMGLGHAEIYFNDSGAYFEVYNTETGEVYIVDTNDVPSMDDYLRDVSEDRVTLGSLELQLKYINKSTEQ